MTPNTDRPPMDGLAKLAAWLLVLSITIVGMMWWAVVSAPHICW
jgi:hypothetical protein